jgi:hypothetical protein
MMERRMVWDKRFFCRIDKYLKSMRKIFDVGENRPGSGWFYPHFMSGFVAFSGR